jgi:hypothetical protein
MIQVVSDEHRCVTCGCREREDGTMRGGAMEPRAYAVEW